VLVLVAVVMLFVVGAMAALSIDVVTLYTARSEAQLAADGAALAGARVFANSGVTSDPGRRSTRNAENLAKSIATLVAAQNYVGGRTLNPAVGAGEIAVSFPNETDTAFDTNPHVTVVTQRADLPTFFARIWGRTVNTVAASATAEAYNPSGANALGNGTIPVAPLCVKPWLLPNLDPTQATGGTATIFDRMNGTISNPALIDQEWPSPNPSLNQNGLYSLCSGDCSGGISSPVPGQYYPGATASFPAPTQALPSCSNAFSSNAYQIAVAGCVQTPISCGTTSTGPVTVNIDTIPYGTTRDADTVAAAECLIHFVSAAGDSDSIDPAVIRPPLEFWGGNQNPIPGAVGQEVMVSDSLVTIPVIDYPGGTPPTVASPSVTVIGFLQVFLNPSATSTLPYSNASSPNQIPATIINMAGCGINATGQPILGNGASPVAVRLISPP
jgi:Putative Flp pilus-assembly TadE/G-like